MFQVSSLSTLEMHSLAVAALSWQATERHAMALQLVKISLTKASKLGTLRSLLLCFKPLST